MKTEKPDAAVVVYSGGMDSFTLLHHARRRHGQVHAITFDYGQRHAREIDCTRKVCHDLDVKHTVVDMRNSIGKLLTGSALTQDGNVAVPEGHYAEENMRATVVPNRNMIMLSAAAGYAISNGIDSVYCGAHSGDHTVYPDCRPQFFDAVQRAVRLGNWNAEHFTFEIPFINYDKGNILHEGKRYGLTADDYADTWTCYKGGEVACGECGSCVERLEAFWTVGWMDPLPYANTQRYLQELKLYAKRECVGGVL